ncbi:hypothetical protein ACFQLX_13350 [Streptomyces polyrhachis]|uniref:Uncharacterized protein n=1 Tax=Streptomyces polyrhachis TaxID=1282885 RepID=A0ABW2GEE6_9ACTN
MTPAKKTLLAATAVLAAALLGAGSATAALAGEGHMPVSPKDGSVVLANLHMPVTPAP